MSSTVQRATGRERDEWFVLLDKWGARGREYREIAEWLTEKHGVSKWWTQKLIVEYEQERGIRDPGLRRNGTFEVGASKTIAVPVERLFDAFVNARQRKRWLTDAKMTLSDSSLARSAKFLWEDGSTRVKVTCVDKGSSKSTVVLTHDRIARSKQAEVTKAAWRDRLAALKSYLED